MLIEVAQHSIAIDAMLYAAQVCSARAQPEQRFKCGQWGHKRREEKQTGVVSMLVLTKLETIRRKVSLVQTVARNTIHGRKQHVRLTRSTREV